MGGQEVAPGRIDRAHGGGIECRQIEGVRVLVAIFETLSRDKTAGRLERQFGPVVDVFDKRDRAKLFQWRRPSLSIGLGASVDKIDEDDWLLTC